MLKPGSFLTSLFALFFCGCWDPGGVTPTPAPSQPARAEESRDRSDWKDRLSPESKAALADQIQKMRDDLDGLRRQRGKPFGGAGASRSEQAKAQPSPDAQPPPTGVTSASAGALPSVAPGQYTDGRFEEILNLDRWEFFADPSGRYYPCYHRLKNAPGFVCKFRPAPDGSVPQYASAVGDSFVCPSKRDCLAVLGINP